MSSRERRERAERARQVAERRAAAGRRRRRRLTSVLSAAGLLAMMAGMYWAVSFVTDEPSPAGDPAAGDCTWVEAAPGHTHGDPGGQGGGVGGAFTRGHPPANVTVDVGVPPTDVPQQGTQLLTVVTNLGAVEVEMELAASPCIAASFTYLAGQEGFYEGSKCHRMFPGMLQCGDPTARGDGYRDTDGQGGPSYQYADENLPTGTGSPYYPAGTVAMANSGEPDTNGSQFFFAYEDMDLNGPHYSVVGEVVSGMDVFAQVDAIGHDSTYEQGAGGGRPNEEIVIESLRVSEPLVPTPSVSPSPVGTPGGG